MKKAIFSLLALTASSNAFAIEDDKIMHFTFSYAIGTVSSHFISNPFTSLAACNSIGAAKELYDEIDYGGFSKDDMIANFAGCATGMISYKLIGHALYISPNNENGLNLKLKYKF